MRVLFLWIFFSFYFVGKAQFDMINLGAGTTVYNHSFLDQNNLFTSPELEWVENVSLGFYNLSMATSLLVETNAGIVELNIAIPKKVVFGDSINMVRNGYVFRLHNFGKVLYASDVFVFNVTGGFSFGTTRFFGDKRLNQRNPFFKIETGLQPRFFLGNFGISFSVFYGLDASSGRWKKSSFFNKTKQIPLPDYKQGGLEAKFSIGYEF